MRGSSRRRRLSWRVRVLLTSSVAVVWLAGPLSVLVDAQAPIPVPANAGDFPECLRSQMTASASSAPSSQERGGFMDPDTVLNGAWICAGHYADRVIVPMGEAMLGGLVVIMIVWTGIGFMFSGEFDLGSLLGTLFLAGFGFIVLLHEYRRKLLPLIDLWLRDSEAFPRRIPQEAGCAEGRYRLSARQHAKGCVLPPSRHRLRPGSSRPGRPASPARPTARAPPTGRPAAAGSAPLSSRESRGPAEPSANRTAPSPVYRLSAFSTVMRPNLVVRRSSAGRASRGFAGFTPASVSAGSREVPVPRLPPSSC